MTRLKQVTEQELVVDAQELLRSRQELKDRLAQCLPHVSDNVRDVAQTLQPPSVLKTQTKFTTTCAFLISDALALFLDPPTVTVSVINESQAIDVNERNQAGLSGLQRQDAVGESGGLQNNQKVLGSASADGVLQAAFKTLSLKKIRRSDKGESDVSVTDEKFSLCYSLTLTLSQGDVVLNLHKLSAPIVVVVHGNQLPSAEATIMWDRAFALPARTGFQVDAVVPWNRVCHALSAYHKHQVGVSLNSDHFVFLSQLAGQSPDNMVYPWPLLAKEPLAGRTFSLWEWFYNICELSRKFLKPVWEAGLIHGFISKDRSEELMMDASPGRFFICSHGNLRTLPSVTCPSAFLIWMTSPTFTRVVQKKIPLGPSSRPSPRLKRKRRQDM
ncbi:uncharacterized protein MONBRDRAFT_44371 [Monosiga brevicollis MX1]|uniref:Uncharacterized protein n=1 Tax=Monosiga brevicollis TaxID=81824 RepID=A9VAI8_MONBE|nr:uncharacterized protein MONBRDRAFT_44371 [Monosiga brevicollis MX1]EDQ85548.1 predicted protein [Monosiga brevicollis MX1]|eukprot:XP_001749739.1 hypothetical protein [Monosiga brevicollis MX1]